MATIRKHRDKWQVQVRRKGFPDHSRTFTYKADALEWATETERQVQRRGLPTDLKLLERLTMADLVSRFLGSVGLRRRGRVNESIVLNAFLRHEIASTRLSELRGTHFSAYRDERLKTVKPATINRQLGIIQRVFEIAKQEWGIPLASNPVKEVRKPKADQGRQRRLQNGEWDRLMDACRQCRNPFVESLIGFAIDTAMRRGELLNAKWGDVNWMDRTLRIPVTKNGHPRIIPLTDKALSVLAGLGNIHEGSERIFPLTCESVKLAWKRLVKRAKVEDLHFHDLRHEAVSRFFELGLSVPEVALISGHRDPRMLFRYTHLKAEDVGRKIRDLSRAEQR